MALSYNKQELNVGDTVFQIGFDQNQNPLLLKYEVVSILDDTNIEIQIERKLEDSVITEKRKSLSNNVHTNLEELVEIWINNLLNQIQKFKSLIVVKETII